MKKLFILFILILFVSCTGTNGLQSRKFIHHYSHEKTTHVNQGGLHK